MRLILLPDEGLSGAGRAAHDVALAALLGGNLFGRFAMHPALEDVSDKAERGKVLNRAWRRYGTVNSLALVALVGGRLLARRSEVQPWRLSPREQSLVLAKDMAVGAVVLTGLASAVGGVAFSRQVPDGAVPMESGSDTAPETPTRAVRLKRATSTLGAANLGSELALVLISSWQRTRRWRRQ
ncbi:MAG: hypothetical protein ACR2IP_00030 [Solirubrobacteraceae bacterium]